MTSYFTSGPRRGYECLHWKCIAKALAQRSNEQRISECHFTVTRCRYWSHCITYFYFISMVYCCGVKRTTTTTQPQHNHNTTTPQPQHNRNTTATQPQHNSSAFVLLLCCGCVVVVVLLWVLWTVALLCHRRSRPGSVRFAPGG